MQIRLSNFGQTVAQHDGIPPYFGGTFPTPIFYFIGIFAGFQAFCIFLLKIIDLPKTGLPFANSFVAFAPEQAAN